MHRADVFDINRGSFLRLEWDILDIFQALDVPTTSHVELGGPHFKDLPAHIAVGHANLVNDLADRDAVGQELVRVQINLILLYEPPDGGDFGDTFYGLEGIPQVPVLKGA